MLREKQRERLTVIGGIMASLGSAVGLGNIWKFPYIAGENGGAIFVVCYLLCVIIGYKFLVAEYLLGRAAQTSPVGAYRRFDKPDGCWLLAGWLNIVTAFVILSFYSIIAGYCYYYTYEAAVGGIAVCSTPRSASVAFNCFSSQTWTPIFFHGLFLASCAAIVMMGIKRGLQQACQVLMPLLVLLLLVILARGLTLSRAGTLAGLNFFLWPNLSNFRPETILLALGHACFTLSVGMGAMITYGSYLDRKTNIPKIAGIVAVGDTVIALLAGLAIFPAVFSTGAEPAAGPRLIFEIFPVIFSKIPYGGFFAFLFFLLLSIAALTSGISLLEVATAHFIDSYKWKRWSATFFTGAIVFLMGIPCSLSFGVMKDATFLKKSWFDWSDYLASNFMLPIGGLLLVLFVGWRWGSPAIKEFCLANNYRVLARIWFFGTRYIAPAAVVAIVVAKLAGAMD